MVTPGGYMSGIMNMASGEGNDNLVNKLLGNKDRKGVHLCSLTSESVS
jgi:hypothetical protein